LLLKFRTYLFISILAFGLSTLLRAQDTIPSPNEATGTDTLTLSTDSLAVDSTKLKNIKEKDDLNSKIDYSADTLEFSNDNQTAYLHGNAKVTYEDLELTAAYMEYNFVTGQVMAIGKKDSIGNDVGLPDFKKGSEKFKSEKLTYNFKTKKAKIFNVVTEQDGGFLHAKETKRQADGSVNLKNGIYTTCNAPHPHFGIHLTKGKLIPGDKIVSGPAYLEFEDVPLPLFLPFGFFPNSKKSSVSGVLVPTFGESSSRGFYLSRGGYYFAINDYVDLSITGDVYSKGNWGLNAQSKYTKRYKYSGNLSVSRYVNKQGMLGVDTGVNKFSKNYDFSIMWSHSQAAQANPNQRFSASVNYTSMSYDKNYNYYGAGGYQNLITTNKMSSISYSRSWTNSNLAVNLGHNQNSATRNVTFNLPTATFSVNRFFPFRRKNPTDNLKWYENLTLSYSAEMQNTFSGTEEDIFTKKTLNTARNGFRHSIPFSYNFKFLKYFNLTPSLSYTGMVYLTHIRYNKAKAEFDTIRTVDYAQDFKPSASLSVNPTIYGMFQFGPKSKVNAIRHVITPNISFNFVPGLKKIAPNYQDTYTDAKTNALIKYGIYDQNMYGTPTGSTRAGSFGFSLGNNLEMKVKSDKDTVTGLKKVVLIQSLSFSTSYNLYATTNKLSQIGWGGNSPIFKGFNVNYSGSIDPYVMKKGVGGGDSTIYYWEKHKSIGRLTNATISFGYNFNGGSGKDKKQKTDTKQPNDPNATDAKAAQPKEDNKPKEDFTYFKVPWNFGFSYNLSYSKPGMTKTIYQTLTFNGSLTLTQKWNISFNSGYDFKNKGFALTQFNITRDLHCFRMSISFSPFGTYKFYEFRIAAVSQFLHDLKYEQNKYYQDYPSGF
jgi:Organic solvent tolerance protein OstA